MALYFWPPSMASWCGRGQLYILFPFVLNCNCPMSNICLPPKLHSGVIPSKGCPDQTNHSIKKQYYGYSTFFIKAKVVFIRDILQKMS